MNRHHVQRLILKTTLVVMLCLVSSILIVGQSAAPASAQATGNLATLPDDLENYLNYATFTHGPIRAEALANPETLAIAKADQPFPPGTRLVLRMFTNGTHSGFFVMEKGVDWGLASSEDDRTGDWHFQQFGVDRQIKREAIADRCQSCHGAAASNDFVFTQGMMSRFIP